MDLSKEEFKRLDKLAHNAVRSIRHSFTGSLTYDDLKQTAWTGILSALKQPKYETHPNKNAYVFTFAAGYVRHALHRKSRMVKVPWETMKLDQSGSAHLSYSWDNLPEPQSPMQSDKLNPNAEAIASTFNKADQNKILAGDFEELSRPGKQLLEIIKNTYNIDSIYE
jgi:DNA-directed RNA polymerase specialized sigma subunit